jgi:thiol-disulfide isomerase/thioredoxin
MNMFIRLLLCAFISNGLHAQSLTKGQTVADVEVGDVLYYETDSIKLNVFQGKLVILEFWSPGCVSCLKAFPEIEMIQREFKDKLQYIMVCRQDKKTIENFFKTRKQITRPNVPFVTGDTLLATFFPHEGNPSFVWIDPDMRVLHTVHAQTNFKTISAFLKGTKHDFKEYVKRQNWSTPLANNWSYTASINSFIGRCNDSLRLVKPSNTPYRTLTYNCLSAAILYRTAHNGLSQFKYELHRPGRLVISAKDSAKLVASSDEMKRLKWREQNTYTYQLLIDSADRRDMYTLMLQDLDRAFNLTNRIEKRPIQTLTLVRTSANDKLRTTGTNTKDNFNISVLKTAGFDSVRQLLNKPFSLFSSRMKGMIEGQELIPFADMTNYSGNIDISIAGSSMNPFNLQELKNQLVRYDLDLVWKDVETTVLVVSSENITRIPK